ncbi:NAD/NADP octopine/nopaline dehydrogenase family protein, partial [Candidatus Woesearchaeota archaeon]|nr:NAD/NADP octopine/nopaline dehydrogenase family protein [Candidatus Woesearchaeota archaeon]
SLCFFHFTVGMAEQIAVCGGGAGGLALAADLHVRGHSVTVYSAFHPKFQEGTGGVKEDNQNGFYRVDAGGKQYLSIPIQRDLSSISSAAYIFIVCPADARSFYLKKAIALADRHALLFLVPGGLGFGLSHLDSVGERGWTELNQLPYVARIAETRTVDVHYRLSSLWCASYPTEHTMTAIGTLESLLGISAQPCQNVVHCGLLNWNMILHPPLMLANAQRIEQQEAFTFYRDGAGNSGIALMEALDNERIAIVKKLGFDSPSLRDYLSGPLGGVSLLDAVISDPVTPRVMAPTNLTHRYVTEDIPYNLVPLSTLGKRIAVETLVADAVITIFSAMLRQPFLSLGIDFRKIDSKAIFKVDKSGGDDPYG